MTEDRRVGQKIVGLTELHAVEEVVEFKAHVEFHALMNSDLLTQDHIEVFDARSAKVIAAQIAGRTKGWNGKQEAAKSSSQPDDA